MALSQLIPSPTSSFAADSHHQRSLNPTSTLNPKSFGFFSDSSLTLFRFVRRPNFLRCSASSFPEKHHPTNPPKSDDVVELPLFPLPLVLLPGAILPLQIFEFRYRIMMHTLLQTAYASVSSSPTPFREPPRLAVLAKSSNTNNSLTIGSFSFAKGRKDFVLGVLSVQSRILLRG